MPTRLEIGGRMMEWKGKRLTKYSDIIKTAFELSGKEQDEFVEKYAKCGPYALQNIGYISGYYNHEKADKIMDVFKTSHPIFGRRHVTPEEAFEKGVELGKPK